MAPRVVFLVLDGLPVEVVGSEVTPVLSQWCDDCGTTPRSIPAVLPAATYPNHATFVTGVSPVEHGLVGNYLLGSDRRFVAARDVGPQVPTLFDVLSDAGLRSAVVVGDQELVGVMGAARATEHWPPGGVVPEGTAMDAHGFVDDAVTLPVLLDALHGDAAFVLGHLNAPDTAGHVEGPGAALETYRATDARLATIRAAVEARGDDTVVIVVSDHSMEPVTDGEPVDLTAALDGTGLAWFPEGTAALVHGDHADVAGVLADTPGVCGVRRLGPALHLVWVDEGRWSCFTGIDAEPGMHGSPRTARQLAAVVGPSSAVRDVDALVAKDGFDATSWFGVVLARLGVAQPA